MLPLHANLQTLAPHPPSTCPSEQAAPDFATAANDLHQPPSEPPGLTLITPAATLEAPIALLGLPTHWRAFQTLELALTNGPAALTIELSILGARNRLTTHATLQPHQSATLTIDLGDLPLAAGVRPLYDPTAIRLSIAPSTHLSEPLPAARAARHSPGDHSASSASAAAPLSEFSIQHSAFPASLRLHRLTLLPRSSPVAPVVDAFGQRASTSWPGKIHSINQLRAHLEVEPNTLLTHFPPPDHRDGFGGWSGNLRLHFPPTGFFHTVCDDAGRWWLVTPLGHPFWSFGAVASADATPLQHRSHLFAELPDPKGPFASCYQPDGSSEEAGFNFYRYNILRKFPSPDIWCGRVLLRFHHLGLNTIAGEGREGGSDDLLLRQESIPHIRLLPHPPTPRLQAAHEHSTDFPSASPSPADSALAFPDIFDPAWERSLDARAASRLTPHHKNALTIGTRLDTELPLPWHDMRLVPPASAAADRADFEALYADKFFATLRRIFKKHAPNHLFLGCPFGPIPPDDAIIAAAGRHVDILSITCHAIDRKTLTRYHTLSGHKPILLTVPALPLASPRQLPPLGSAFTPDERPQRFIQLVQQCASLPFVIGVYALPHTDPPLTGRASDGENHTTGLVDITDQLHPDLAPAVHRAAAGVYPWHYAAR